MFVLLDLSSLSFVCFCLLFNCDMCFICFRVFFLLLNLLFLSFLINVFIHRKMSAIIRQTSSQSTVRVNYSELLMLASSPPPL